MVKLKAPESNKSGAGFSGVFYPIDESGCITVPPEAVEALLEMGFTVEGIDHFDEEAAKAAADALAAEEAAKAAADALAAEEAAKAAADAASKPSKAGK